ncbi:hypothetical protein [Pedobacter sp.]|uniref:hypothetical protein n=1 Tax=Pedobacter sp. TaxID=1411316 RepID=UPI00396CA141
MKRFYFVIIILIAAIFIMAYQYFKVLNKGNSDNEWALNQSASNAALLVSFDNDKTFYEIINGQGIIRQVIGDQKTNLLKSIYEDFSTNSSFKTIAESNKVFLGFVPLKNKEIGFMIALQLKNKINPAIFKHLNPENNNHILKIKSGDSTQYYISFNDNKLAIADNEDCLLHIFDSKNTTNNFASYIRTQNKFSKNVLANIYVDFNHLPQLLAPVLNSELNGELNVFKQKDIYANYSYNFSTEKLLLNGYLDIQNNQNYFKLFENIPEQKIYIDEILPDKTANYAIYSINDYANWQKALIKWHNNNKSAQKAEQQLNLIKEKYRIDLNQILPKYIKNQFGCFELNTGEKFGLVALNNGDKLSQALLDLSAEYSPEIRIFKESGILYGFFGEPFKKFDRPFYVIKDNFLVVSNNAGSLQVFLNSYNNGKLLAATSGYQQFISQLPNASTILYYINNDNSTDIFSKNLKTSYYKHFRSESGFKNYNAYGVQLMADNGKFLSNVVLMTKQKELSVDSLIHLP